MTHLLYFYFGVEFARLFCTYEPFSGTTMYRLIQSDSQKSQCCKHYILGTIKTAITVYLILSLDFPRL